MSEETVPGFSPLSDQVLVRVLALEDRTGKLWLPVSVDHGRMPIRRGVVVALGCGDIVAPRCSGCGGTGKRNHHKCGACRGSGYLPHTRTEFAVKAGDEVLFHARPWAEYSEGGADYIVLHDCQHILAVLDETISFHPVRRSEAREAHFEGERFSSHQ